VALRCNNREFLFDDAAFALFHEALQAARRRFALLLYHCFLSDRHTYTLTVKITEKTLDMAWE